MYSPHDCAVSPDLQVGLGPLGIICVEVSQADLAPELQEGAGIRNGVCPAEPQQGQQRGDPPPRLPQPGRLPVHPVWGPGVRPGCLHSAQPEDPEALLQVLVVPVGSPNVWMLVHVDPQRPAVPKSLGMQAERHSRIYTETDPPSLRPVPAHAICPTWQELRFHRGQVS